MILIVALLAVGYVLYENDKKAKSASSTQSSTVDVGSIAQSAISPSPPIPFNTPSNQPIYSALPYSGPGIVSPPNNVPQSGGGQNSATPANTAYWGIQMALNTIKQVNAAIPPPPG